MLNQVKPTVLVFFVRTRVQSILACLLLASQVLEILFLVCCPVDIKDLQAGLIVFKLFDIFSQFLDLQLCVFLILIELCLSRSTSTLLTISLLCSDLPVSLFVSPALYRGVNV